MIYDTQTVYAPDIEAFDRALNRVIDSYQDGSNGTLHVDVQFQYATSDDGSVHRYAALVIARKPLDFQPTA